MPGAISPLGGHARAGQGCFKAGGKGGFFVRVAHIEEFMTAAFSKQVSLPIRVGLVGTGYAAKLRAETFTADGRSRLVAVTGHRPEKVAEFCQTYGAEAVSTWGDLIQRPDLDLIVIATINRDHGPITRAALEAGKAVIVEYPLSLQVEEAVDLIAIASDRQQLLHVEHIELLSGIHGAIAQSLPAIGTPFYVRYSSINPQRPAPNKWTYQPELFGFPLIGALSRIHRLTNLFGAVTTASCQTRFWGNAGLPSPYTSCLCTAQLRFASGLVADLVYGKGEAFWQEERDFLAQGDQGGIVIRAEDGRLVRQGETLPLDMGTRRGLFARDTTMVLDCLEKGTPLYVSPTDSVYALRVADAARRSAETGQTVSV